ncbi:uncharacterized protein F5147DRAFT_377659 [Suillus discolor]|uniref:Uncharacterized protein n=1 Tax=Suillus discolor TaxID=1912936 RepID=A0A9P7EZ74_9AGAM|nr:uncharacterized protein F5147DRAFT_377659 [Suillus discolor]KAG2096511.1 hypothetical protein F5147DRAFT_377659 [Suillus discolor]
MCKRFCGHPKLLASIWSVVSCRKADNITYVQHCLDDPSLTSDLRASGRELRRLGTHSFTSSPKVHSMRDPRVRFTADCCVDQMLGRPQASGTSACVNVPIRSTD